MLFQDVISGRCTYVSRVYVLINFGPLLGYYAIDAVFRPVPFGAIFNLFGQVIWTTNERLVLWSAAICIFVL